MIELLLISAAVAVFSGDDEEKTPATDQATPALTQPANAQAQAPEATKPPSLSLKADTQAQQTLQSTLSGMLADCALSPSVVQASQDFANGQANLLSAFLSAKAIPLIFTQENVTWGGYSAPVASDFYGLPATAIFAYKSEEHSRYKVGLSIQSEFRTTLRTLLPELPPGALNKLQIEQRGSNTEVACLL